MKKKFVKKTPIQVLKRLSSFISARRKIQILTLFILMIAGTFAEILSIGSIIPFLSALSGGDKSLKSKYAEQLLNFFHLPEHNHTVEILALIFVATVVASGGLRIAQLFFQTKLSYAIGADISGDIYLKTLHQPYSIHVERNSASVISVIATKSNSVSGNAMMPILAISSSVLTIIAILVMLILIEPQITIISFGLIACAYVVCTAFSKRSLEKNSLIVSKEQSEVMKSLQEGLGGIREVLLDGAQNIFYSIYLGSDLPLRRANATIHIVSNIPRLIIEPVGLLILVILSVHLSNGRDVTTILPAVGAFVFGVQRLLPLMQQTYLNYATIIGGQASLVDVLDLLEQKMPISIGDRKKPLRFEMAIELENLSYSYPTQAKPALRNIDLKIEKGSRIGIIGETGGGKSTLVDVLMGLVQPEKGQIMVDGESITGVNCSSWQSCIAHVPQKIFLSDASIIQNIAFGIPSEQIERGRVVEAAKIAQINSVIEGWERGYETKIGEGGVRLSGGQRQRVGIARALYRKNLKLLVLDEATSALDGDTEKKIMEAISKLDEDITIVMVAHRITTLSQCNKILELKDGVIVRQCKYEDLLNSIG